MMRIDVAWGELWQGAKDEAAALDRLIDGWVGARTAAGKRIFCGAGCSSCCTLFVQTTLVEAMIVADQLAADQLQSLKEYVLRQRETLASATDFLSILRRQRTQIGPCPFLDSAGECRIYTHRPLACRALLSTKDPAWCGVDFTTLDPLEKRLYLESLEREVVAYPVHYLAPPQEAAQNAEERILEAMRSHFGCAISGNFPLLVYLAASQHLVDVAPPILPVTLRASEFYHPHLIHIQSDEMPPT